MLERHAFRPGILTTVRPRAIRLPSSYPLADSVPEPDLADRPMPLSAVAELVYRDNESLGPIGPEASRLRRVQGSVDG
ncbi:hypothetical protein NS230_02140 [Methylobacterium indicum]|nr:hypothetical protein QR78_10300 [Methylobacterium indicum]KTS38155.1 hypothetical protein NS229_04585 [Methylobacterium indicum]KTS54276.1 hypothetical protein NS230_02140 [Methylobacterium indicum]